MSFLMSAARAGCFNAPSIIQTRTNPLYKWTAGGVPTGQFRLPSDPVGMTNVTFDGLPSGVEVHVYLPDGPDQSAGTELNGIESSAVNQVLSWAVYSPGSPNNNVWITLLKRGMRFQKFRYTAKAGDQTLPIFMQQDLGYNNPA